MTNKKRSEGGDIVKTVLIIEDEVNMQRAFARELFDLVEVIPAYAIEEAERLFSEHADQIDIITFDGCLRSQDPNTPPLVRKLRPLFAGPMIAASADEEYRRQLLEAGCDREIEKSDLAELVLELAGLACPL